MHEKLNSPNNPSEPNETFVIHNIPGLGTRVDLPGRFTYITARDVTIDWHPATDMAVWLDCMPQYIHKTARELGIESNRQKLYPPLAFEVIEQEYIWQKYYSSLPAKIQVSTIHNYLGWHYDTIRRHATELGYQPTKNKGLYSKALLAELRRENLSVPMDEGWHTVRALCEQLGEDIDREWVERRLKEGEFAPEQRRITGDGSVRSHYEPESFSYLLKRISEIPPPGAESYTACFMSAKIGRSYGWAARRLKHYDDVAEMQLDDMGVPRKHYPKSVLDELAQEARIYDTYEKELGWLSLKQVAEKFEITEHSAMRALDKLGVEKRRFMGENNLSIYCYDGDTVMNIAWSIAEADKNMLTQEQIAMHFGRSTRTVYERLLLLKIKPAYIERIGGNRQWYKRSVLKKLATVIYEKPSNLKPKK